MSYDPGSKVYYGTNGSASDRLVPAPQVSFSTEMVYANDTIAGYSYIVSLNGYATALDLTTGGANEYGLKDMSDAIHKVREIFSLNGGSLYVTNKNDSVIMECRGGTIRSLSFEESANNWVNYAPYKVEIEFSEIIISGCNISNTINCNTLSVDSNGTAPNLVDLVKYKIKSFNDNWSFNISEAAYNNYGDFQNQYVEIEYSVSATGKNFYNDQKKLLPAWEQAKNFVQDRLYDQVKGLIGSILNRGAGADGCVASKTLSQLHSVASPGGIDGISSSTHKIYNETITCEAGEAEGTFSATYKSILKYNSTNALATDCIHTFNKSKSIQNDGKTTNVSISVQGSISGLVPGGLINTPNIIEFPKTGKLFLVQENNLTKYSAALAAYGGVSDGQDLSSTMKGILGINPDELLITGGCVSSPRASSFSSTHEYTAGSISYSAEYSTNRSCANNSSYRNISISVEEGVPMIAEFVIPGRSSGPIIQRLGPSSPTRVNVNIEGVSQSIICCPNIAQSVTNVCDGSLGLPNDIPSANVAGMILVQNQETLNSIDGSYNISRSYIKIA
jgi:hypothetical protein